MIRYLCLVEGYSKDCSCNTISPIVIPPHAFWLEKESCKSFQRFMDKCFVVLILISCSFLTFSLPMRTNANITNNSSSFFRISGSEASLLILVYVPVEFLGHDECNRLVGGKFSIILDHPEPQFLESLRCFLGVITHCCRFIPTCFEILQPLIKPLKRVGKVLLDSRG